MTMTGKERAALRSECNRLRAMIHVGQEGLTETLGDALDDALRTRELVKIQLTKSADGSAKELAQLLAGQLGAEVIQTIGRTATLYRHNPKLKRKPGSPPPWRE